MHDFFQPELIFIQQGDDLFISLLVDANNSPHVLWTKFHHSSSRVIPKGGSVEDAVQESRVLLYYSVFQNRDLYTRSLKSVKIEWRLPGHRRGTASYEVLCQFNPDSKELRELIPQLEVLAVRGEHLSNPRGGVA